MTVDELNLITAQALGQTTNMGSIVQQLIGIIQQMSAENELLKKNINDAPKVPDDGK